MLAILVANIVLWSGLISGLLLLQVSGSRRLEARLSDLESRIGPGST